MKKYHIDHLVRLLKTSSAPVVLYGAGENGKVALYALNKLAIKVDYFCDDANRKQNNLFLGIPVISPKALEQLDSDLHVLICSSYAINPVISRLRALGINNIHTCISLFENTDFSGMTSDMNPSKLKRTTDLYRAECASIQKLDSNEFDIKYVDIVITERCSMKCESCSNLMQYYVKPNNSDYDLLLTSVDKFMKVIGQLYEFRILGGEPFVNKQIGKIVNKLSEYRNAENIVIYTNATIIPKGENLECLKSKKVFVEITDYGDSSRNHAKLIELFKLNNIRHTTHVPIWTDSGTINYKNKTEKKLIHMFKNCCVKDILVLLNGKLYRCPFSANAMNLGAIPINGTDVVNLSDDSKSLETTKKEILALYKDKEYLTACSYCNGRDYTTPEIDAAIQTKNPLPIPPQPMLKLQSAVINSNVEPQRPGDETQM